MTKLTLAQTLSLYSKDPLKFVLCFFPWEEEGELKEFKGPEPWQRRVLMHIHDKLENKAAATTIQEAIQIAVASGHGVGKALAHGEPVLTPYGWKPIEFIEVGDTVIAGDGTYTLVTGVFPQGEREIYRVTLNDGCSVLVDKDHQWFTTTRSDRKHEKNGTVKTTAQISKSLRFPNGVREGLNHQIPTCGAIQYSKAPLPIEPYLFGCWLGDGDAMGRLCGEPQIIESLAQAGASFGIPQSKSANGVLNKASTYSILGIRPALRALGLFGCRSHEKSIPQVYLHSSIEQRIALLQGLLDTDGTVGKNNNAVVFDITAPKLADDTAELARSLGGVVCRSEKMGSYNGKICRKVYRLFISLPRDIAPFRLPAKAKKYKPAWDHHNCLKTRRRFIESVDYVGVKQATCIAVAHPSHLYVTRDHIVTHNSSLVSWIMLWAITTFPNTRGVVTANTETQLKTKTWAELGKWHRLLQHGLKDHFKLTATAIFSQDAEYERTWRIDMVPWSERNQEAFAGLHNKNARILLVFDEASAIPDTIWETSEGALTDSDTQIIWMVCGNPTRNTGRFRECFGRYSSTWWNEQVDSRTVSITNKDQFKKWIRDYGDDSDFVRVRIKGVFPRAGSMQFIASDTAEEAAEREILVHIHDPLVFGVDVARFGDDESVIYIRKGRDGRSNAPIRLRGVDTMTLAGKVCELYQKFNADAVFIDGGGVGGGVVDRLRQLRVPVYDVQFGAKPSGIGFAQDDSGTTYANKRAEIWGSMREWLKSGSIPDDTELKSQLISVEYGFNVRNEIQLERKEDMKKRGLASPDLADALALTFALPVAKSEFAGGEYPKRTLVESEYNPFDPERMIA